MRVWTDSSQYVKSNPGVYGTTENVPLFIGETTSSKICKIYRYEFEGDECKQMRVFVDPKEIQLQLIEDFKNQTGNAPICNAEIKLETP